MMERWKSIRRYISLQRRHRSLGVPIENHWPKRGWRIGFVFNLDRVAHGTRTHSCTPGAEQMQEIQNGHLSQIYYDIGYDFGI